MAKNENKMQLKQTIAMLKMKIENLKPHIETSERLNTIYNKMLVEKAILKDELERTNPTLLSKLAKRFSFGFRKKRLISDYFKS